MKIPFTLDAWLKDKSQKVETRDGKPARIICWDKKEYEDQREQPTPIVYLITSKGGCEHIMSCTTDGMYSDGLERDSDLFIADEEPELTCSDIAHSIFSSIVDAVSCDEDTGRILANRCASLIKSYIDGEKETLEGEHLTMWEECIFKLIRQYKECIPFTIGNVMADAKMLLDDAKYQLRKDGYTVEKHNQLFDECVEKVNPEVKKEVDANIDKANSASEKELTEFEHALGIALMEHEGTEDTYSFLKEKAAELLDLARKEIENEVPEMEFEPIEDTLEYKAGFRAGKSEALKDLPRWDESQFEMDAPCVNFEWLHVGKKMIYLPDLEKLPGFKED